MIYVTGDVHGEQEIGKRLNTKNFPEQKGMSKADYVIITGDFGLVWNLDKEDQHWLKWLDKVKPFTTLFIDGNHENFELLNRFPVETWNGGNIHRINDSVYHLMRGQVFSIEGSSFYTFGGAASTDKAFRTQRKSWWPEEIPSYAEFEEGLKNLDRCGWNVDYVLTHTCSEETFSYLTEQLDMNLVSDPTRSFFSTLEEKLQYRHWFFGHFHTDLVLPRNQRLLYQDRIKL